MWGRVARAKRHWLAAVCCGGILSFSCGLAGAVGNSEKIGENDNALAERLVRLEVAGRLCSGVVYTSSVVLTAAHYQAAVRRCSSARRCQDLFAQRELRKLLS